MRIGKSKELYKIMGDFWQKPIFGCYLSILYLQKRAIPAKMKATYTLLPDFTTAQKPFVVKQIVRSSFATDFHFHNECQLVYILSGAGTRIIGGTIERFECGDLTFVGPNVPHVWYSEFNPASEHEPAVSVALYINPTTLTEYLKPFVDTKLLEEFFVQSKKGISFSGKKKERIIGYLQDMLESKNMQLLASFLQIMVLLLDPEDMIWLNRTPLLSTFTDKNQNRVSRLMEYIQQNFREDITIEQAASVAGLQLHSFCRFFKNLTYRTFSDFLNEVRIAFACQLLQQTDLPITQVAFESGYSNVSYFNRSFKKIHQHTPREFRAQMSTLH